MRAASWARAPCAPAHRAPMRPTAAALLLLCTALAATASSVGVTAAAAGTADAADGGSPPCKRHTLSHYASVLLTGAGLQLPASSPLLSSSLTQWGAAVMGQAAPSLSSNTVGAEFLADRHAVHELLVTLFQAVIPGLRKTTRGRPPLAPETDAVFLAAHRLAAVTGLDRLEGMGPPPAVTAAVATGAAAAPSTAANASTVTADGASRGTGAGGVAAAVNARRQTMSDADTVTDGKAQGRQLAGEEGGRDLWLTETVPRTIPRALAAVSAADGTRLSSARSTLQAAVDPAGAGSGCEPRALCDELLGAIEGLQRTVTALQGVVCSAAPAAAAAIITVARQGWPNATGAAVVHDGGEFGILRQLALVRRVVIGVMHALDRWDPTTGTPATSPAAAGLAGAAGAGAAPAAVPAGAPAADLGTDAAPAASQQSPQTAGPGPASTHHGAPEGSLRTRIRAAGRALLEELLRADQCADRGKVGGIEVMHISKSGGSTMCELARRAGMKNPAFNPSANCKVYSFKSLPRWMWRFPTGVPPRCQEIGDKGHWLLARIPCKEWVTYPMLNCKTRAAVMQMHRFNFVMNEVGLHGGSPGQPAAAHTCPFVHSALVLREPVDRVASHIAHVERTYVGNAKMWCAKVLAGLPISMPRGSQHPPMAIPPWPNITASVAGWLEVAPVVLDNYMLRQLFGQGGVCVPAPEPKVDAEGCMTHVSRFTASDALLGAGTLAQFDHLLAMPPAPTKPAVAGAAATVAADVAASNNTMPGCATTRAVSSTAGPGQVGEVVVRLGMGWPQGLQGNVTVRRAPSSHEIERELGFPPGSSAAVAMLNAWDAALVGLGSRLAVLDAAVLATAAQMEGGEGAARAATVQSRELLLFGMGAQ